MEPKSSGGNDSQRRQLPYIIAEIGINHNGDFDLAKSLITAAADCGVDAVKFQKRDPDICVPEHQKDVIRDTPWGKISYLEYKKQLEFDYRQYKILRDLAHSSRLEFSASAWDLSSLEFLDKLSLDFHKVASALITNQDFLSEIARRGMRTIASTGMTTWQELDRAVEILRPLGKELTLLHTVSTYPADEANLNLLMIRTLENRYGLSVGYSGHEASVSPSIFASALGATVIERHFTLSRASWGTDHSASLEPEGMRRLVGAVKKRDKVFGDGIKKTVPGETEVAKKLRYW